MIVAVKFLINRGILDSEIGTKIDNTRAGLGGEVVAYVW